MWPRKTMRKKHEANTSRDKCARSVTRGCKRDRFKGQPVVDSFDQGSRCLDAEHCSRSRKKKSTYTVCSHRNPTMDNRSRLALNTGTQYSRPNTVSCRRKVAEPVAKPQSRSHFSLSPMPGCFSPPGRSRRPGKEHIHMPGPHKRDVSGGNLDYPDDNCSVASNPVPKFRSQRVAYSDHGEDVSKFDHEAFPSSGSRSWSGCGGYNMRDADSTGLYTSKYMPSSTRPFANIMAEYLQPRNATSDGMMGPSSYDIGNTSSNSISSRNHLFNAGSTGGLSRDHMSAFQTNYAPSQHYNRPKTTSDYLSSISRPRSAGGHYQSSSSSSSSKPFPDYRDDMYTIALNSVKNNYSNSNRAWSSDLPHYPNYERKPLSSHNFESSGNSNILDEVEAMVRARSRPRATSYDTSFQSGYSGQYRNKYESPAWSGSPREYDGRYDSGTGSSYSSHGFTGTGTGYGTPNAYDFSSRASDSVSHHPSFQSNGMTSSHLFDNTGSLGLSHSRPFTSQVNSLINSNLQTEKERLNKIATIIGRSTYPK